jgi:Fibronectin type II domain
MKSNNLSFIFRTAINKPNKSPYEVYFPKSLPVKIWPTDGLCDLNSGQGFYMKGQWFTGKISENPMITFKVNATSTLFQFEFRPGDGKANFSKYVAWSMLNGVNSTVVSEVVLKDLDPSLDVIDYNLTITCDNFNTTGTFKIVVNYWNPNGDPNGILRNSSNWDTVAPMNNAVKIADVSEVRIQGVMNVYYAGFTANQCLGIAPNGLVLTLSGTDCGTQRKAVCEYKSCYTTQGNECVFPFYYKNVLYKNCTSEDVYLPWCATKVNSSTNAILDWGLCLDDCNYQVPVVSCLAPPPVPNFGVRNSTGYIIKQNYISDWFQLDFLNNSDGSLNFTTYSIRRSSRKRLFQPLMLYNANNITEENLQIFVHSNSDFFNDVYEIKLNGSNATYTCPLGWVFEDSHNISQYAYCRNWTWTVDFDTTKSCVRK